MKQSSDFEDTPPLIWERSSSGVPGTVSYDVNAQCGDLGNISVSVPQAPSSRHAISATTTMGAITIAPL